MRRRRNRHLIPKEYYESTLDWVKNSNLNKDEILYEIYPQLPIPKVEREEEKLLLNNKPRFSNKAFVVNMPYGRVLGEKAVISPDNKLLWDVSVEWARGPKEHSIFKHTSVPSLTKTDETVALLNHPAARNYYHWLLEALARIHLIEQSGIKIDKYIVNHSSFPFQLETLPICGIDPKKIIHPNETFHLEAKNLIIPSYVNLPNLWSCNYIRNLFFDYHKPKVVDGYERILIKRNNYRKIINEDEIMPILDKFGFRSISLETLSVEKQIEVFNNAKIVISPHGAGLANLIFSKPGTTVIELFTPSFLEPHYWLLSRLSHLDYRMIVGNRENPHHYWVGYDNLSIDPKQLLTVLNEVVK